MILMEERVRDDLLAGYFVQKLKEGRNVFQLLRGMLGDERKEAIEKLKKVKSELEEEIDRLEKVLKKEE